VHGLDRGVAKLDEVGGLLVCFGHPHQPHTTEQGATTGLAGAPVQPQMRSLILRACFASMPRAASAKASVPSSAKWFEPVRSARSACYQPHGPAATGHGGTDEEQFEARHVHQLRGQRDDTGVGDAVVGQVQRTLRPRPGPYQRRPGSCSNGCSVGLLTWTHNLRAGEGSDDGGGILVAETVELQVNLRYGGHAAR
jgi:hypothetical protein